jgi:[ribosomal protein S5]-alanine N-acetyltransferase
MSAAHLPTLRGARLSLRVVTRADESAFIRAARASTRLPGQWVDAPRDAATFAAYVERRGDSFVPLCLTRHEDRALLGVCNLSQIYMGSFCSAYLGYYAFEPHQQQGYMREGIALLLALAFGPLGLHRVEANIQPENSASIALAQRCGFQREGYSPGYLYIAGAWRDHERWAYRRELIAAPPCVR